MEHIGINPIIVLIPRYAFVGWKIWKDSDNYSFLETTMISSSTYEEAVEAGIEQLSKTLENARRHMNNPKLSFEEADNLGLIRFVKISEMRSMGILPTVI